MGFIIDLATALFAGSTAGARMAETDVKWRAQILAQAHPDQVAAALAEAEARLREIEAARGGYNQVAGRAVLVFGLGYLLGWAIGELRALGGGLDLPRGRCVLK
jgi:hypothetical protein